jgi:hypothetical protein
LRGVAIERVGGYHSYAFGLPAVLWDWWVGMFVLMLMLVGVAVRFLGRHLDLVCFLVCGMLEVFFGLVER